MRQVADDGQNLYGTEFELPPLFVRDLPWRFFFWSSIDMDCFTPYEDAAFQAIACLQTLYGFAVVDYNYENMQRQRQFLRQLFSFANRSAQPVRMVTTAAQYSIPLDSGIL